jgi:hypothetical protein
LFNHGHALPQSRFFRAPARTRTHAQRRPNGGTNLLTRNAQLTLGGPQLDVAVGQSQAHGSNRILVQMDIRSQRDGGRGILHAHELVGIGL